MNKTLLTGLVALSLAFVALPAQADHLPGCVSSEPYVCASHVEIGDGSCSNDYSSTDIYVYDDSVPAAVGANGWSECRSFFGNTCEGDGGSLAAVQGSRRGGGTAGYSFVSVAASEFGCGGYNGCRVNYRIQDTNTGTYEAGNLYNEECDDTL